MLSLTNDHGPDPWQVAALCPAMYAYLSVLLCTIYTSRPTRQVSFVDYVKQDELDPFEGEITSLKCF